MKNFFITYNKVDLDWAKWLVWQLEEIGYSTTAQFKDFPPGSNFLNKMNEALAACDRFVAVLSPEYVASEYTRAEYTAEFTRDPAGQIGRLIPVRVRLVDPPPVLRPRGFLDLIDLDEPRAVQALRDGIALHKLPATPIDSAARWGPRPDFPFQRIDVELEYCDGDSQRIEPIATALEAKGLQVRRDRWIGLDGEPVRDRPMPPLLKTRCWAVLASDKSPSKWVYQRIGEALERRESDKTLTVIPIRMPGAPEELEDDLRDIRIWADRTDAVRLLFAAATGKKLEKQGLEPALQRTDEFLTLLKTWVEDDKVPPEEAKEMRTVALKDTWERFKDLYARR